MSAASRAGTQLGLLAKYPQPGAVKTRLAASIGDAAAAALQRAFLEASLRRFAGCAQRCVLAGTPADRLEDFRPLAPAGWDLEPQGPGDLGARMRHFFENALAAGAERAVVLGADSPDLPRGIIARAFAALNRQPVVLGPSHDGGYYLLGIAGRVPPLFEGVDWGTGSVWEQTLARLEAAGLGYAELPRWHDVDDQADLQRLRRGLRQAPAGGPGLERLQQIIEQVLAQSGRSG